MKIFCPIFFFLIILFFPAVGGQCEDPLTGSSASGGESFPSLDEIIDRVESRYAVPGFSLLFFQQSTLKAMDITDSASGRIFIKRPGMMRWEYEKPERQIIVTDGRELWVYRPEDNQVIVGKAPYFFGEGRGAGFLSDMTLIRKAFFILPGKKTRKDHYQVKLLPREKTMDIANIDLMISKETFDLVQVDTFNEFGDETRIFLSDFQVHPDLDVDLFRFSVPEGADIVHLDESTP